MRCPFCATVENRVIDSRMARDGRAIRRRRHCDGCGVRFTTYEEAEHTFADVEKRGGHTEPFDLNKLTRSLRLACKKRPVPLTTLTEFAERLEARISARPRKTITSQEIGEAVLVFLRDRDPVAYVRYASVYRSFATIDEFTRELRTFGPGAAQPAALPPAEEPAPQADDGAGLVDPF